MAYREMLPRFGHRAIAGAVSILIGTACVHPAASTPTSSRRAFSASSRLLTQQELEPLGTVSLDDALLRLRPELLRYHGRTVSVYINGRPAVWFDLHGLRADGVARVRLLSPVEAAIEYGAFSAEPILDVRLRSTF